MSIFDRIMEVDGLCSRSCMENLVRFARLAPPKGHVVDLGTYRGRSAAMLCHAVGDSRVVTIDHWQMPTHGGSTATIARMNLSRLGYSPRLVTGLSHNIPSRMESVSVLFIDSYHNDKTVRRELDAWVPFLVDQAVVMFHDYEPSRFSTYVDVIREVLRPPNWTRLATVEDFAVFRFSQVAARSEST